MFDFSAWTNENSLALVTIILTLAGAIVALWQWRQRTKIQRSEFVKQLIEKLRFDESVSAAAYLIDYTQDWYHEKFHYPENRDTETKVDKYLAYLSYLCYLIETKSVTPKEVQLFEYKLYRTVQNMSVQAYLWNLTHFAEKFGIKYSCYNLVEYGIKKKIINEDFLTNKIDKFPKRLNF